MADTTIARCDICGEPMPVGEEMFKFHGYSGNCPKPPLARQDTKSAARPHVVDNDRGVRMMDDNFNRLFALIESRQPKREDA